MIRIISVGSSVPHQRQVFSNFNNERIHIIKPNCTNLDPGIHQRSFAELFSWAKHIKSSHPLVLRTALFLYPTSLISNIFFGGYDKEYWNWVHCRRHGDWKRWHYEALKEMFWVRRCNESQVMAVTSLKPGTFW